MIFTPYRPLQTQEPRTEDLTGSGSGASSGDTASGFQNQDPQGGGSGTPFYGPKSGPCLYPYPYP